ncbi:DNA sulfur modification protein DndE [Maritimibacter sp. 55A14]|uniref:DNA sulfur modification protein DndE n=1 Tax=Maritimibacter sp. 55A14 TaxID=2174844 RepID=UPI000D6137DC|nr:DNA sulfur modification protein DndE [Maritimibacter sp. 55A14]PWE34121.1 DNA sulfur modification protein DndE [Maritimibacter sp. 55A14]
MAIEHIRLSQQAKDQLIKLKRVTGIENWNVLCRWALCLSLAEQTVPPSSKIPADSNVEMSWKIFGGRYADLYMALLRERCVRDGLGTDPEVVAQQFRLHLHRGISYLAGNRNLRRIDDLTALVTSHDLAVAKDNC